MENLEIKLKNLTNIVILGFVILGLLIIGLYFKGNSVTNETTKNEEKSSNSTYDVSKMNEVDVAGALNLFKKDGLQVLYIGRSDCGVCVETVPVLNKVQDELKYKTNYFDLNSTKNWQTEMKELADLFTVKTTVKTTVKNKDGKAETVTLNDTIGKIFLEYGFTPTIIVIKDGKMVDGFIGYKDYDTMKSLIEKYV